MEQFAYTILQLLRRHYAPLQPGYPADNPRYQSIGLKLAPEDDSEEAKALLRTCQDFLSYNRGHIRALREKTLPRDRQYIPSSQLSLMYENLIQLQAARKAPTTPWIQELLNLEASLDERLYYRILSSKFFLFSTRKANEIGARTKFRGFSLKAGLTNTHSGMLLTTLIKEESGVKHEDTFLLDSLHIKVPETIADEIQGLAQAIKLGRGRIRELGERYERGEIISATMRQEFVQAREVQTAQSIANRLANSLDRSERKLLKAHLHLLTKQL